MKEERAKEQPVPPPHATAPVASNANIEDIMAEIEMAEQEALKKVSSRVCQAFSFFVFRFYFSQVSSHSSRLVSRRNLLFPMATL
jgi:hypothetical protein